jgi:AsmA family protein
MRGPIGRYLSRRTGHEVRIDGNLKVDLFTWQPRIDAAGIYVGNPAWADRPQAARIEDLKVEVRLWPLVFGRLVVPLVSIDHPDVLVVRDASGRTNWDRQDAGNGEAWKLPPIQRFLINDGHLQIDDAVRKLNFTGGISSREEVGGKAAAFSLTGDGTLNRNKFLADVRGGPLLNVDASKPYHFSADVHAGDTHAIVHGAITEPFHLDRYQARVSVTGKNLSDLYYLIGLALPGTPPYELQADVTRDGKSYRLASFKGQLGSSDISGELAVDTSAAVPRLSGKLASRSLSFDDLGAVVGGGKSAVKSKFLLPDTPLHTERLKQTDAEVDYTAASIHSRDFPLTGLHMHIGLEGGVLKLDPLAFGFTRGKLSGSLKVDARGDVPVTAVDARITDIHVEQFIQGKDKPVAGVVEARARMAGQGRSVHEAASTANGTFTVVVPSGQMRQTLAEWLGVNLISALGLTLAGDDSNTNVRCAVAHFTAKDGVMNSERFIFDTDPVRVDGHGAINLKDETVDLTLAGKPKSFQLLRVRAPIVVKGPWAHPGLGIDPKPALTQGGIGVALAVVNPFAAILAFIDPGLNKDANCAGLLTTAKAQGAPVKASAVKNAARRSK